MGLSGQQTASSFGSATVKVTRLWLTDFDPEYINKGDEERYLCYWCGNEKPKDNRHRSFCLNLIDNIWQCHRCKIKGKLDTSKEKQLSSRQTEDLQKQREARRSESKAQLQENLPFIQPLKSSAGSKYLSKERAIPEAIAIASNVKYAPRWFGAPAVLFPIRKPDGKLSGISARYIDKWRYIQHRTSGFKMDGVFSCAHAWDNDFVIITEAPIDALSLATVGFPAIATCGEGLPSHIIAALSGVPTLIAADNDKEGLRIAQSLVNQLALVQCDAVKVVPEAKDWNKMLQDGQGDIIRQIICSSIPECVQMRTLE